MRRPVVAALGSAAVLLALAAPVRGMEPKNGALDQFPRDHEVVRGFEAASAIRDVRIDVGGVTASQIDLDDLIGGGMWKILLFLLGLFYVVARLPGGRRG